MKNKQKLSFQYAGQVISGNREGLVALQKALNKAISSPRACTVVYSVNGEPSENEEQELPYFEGEIHMTE